MSEPLLEGCELCREAGGHALWRDADWRVVRVAADAFPAYDCRLPVSDFRMLVADSRLPFF